MSEILRVKNSKDHTTGFLVNNSYVTYNDWTSLWLERMIQGMGWK